MGAQRYQLYEMFEPHVDDMLCRFYRLGDLEDFAALLRSHGVNTHEVLIRVSEAVSFKRPLE